MYTFIVKSRLRKAIAGLNAGHIDAITETLSTDAEHYFMGEHALGGTRRTPRAIYNWYERLLRLLPDIHFELGRIDVQGWPWDTLAVLHWRESNTGTDGVRASNEGVHVLRLKWGKVTSVRIYTDTVVLIRTLDRLASKGVAEAHAAPIVD